MAAAVGRLSYSNKAVLAPMVRIGTLPARLLALRYGADIVYTEELIDHKMCQCRRRENPLLGTIDFVLPDDTVVLRTTAAEKDKVVFQMGTSDPDRALKAGLLVAADVAGIDVNMGCPKAFSLKGGMGSALLTQPETVRAILTSLVKGIPSKPITCKIRLLPSKEDTFNLIKVIQSTGVAAIGIHGRLQQQRSREPISADHQQWMREIAASSPIPIIANGGSLDIQEHGDIAKFREATGCSSVMVARAAQWNLSVFRKEGLLPIAEVARDFLRLSVTYDNDWSNTKYCLMVMLHNQQLTETGARLRQAKGLQEFCQIWDCSADYDALLAARKLKAGELGMSLDRCKFDDTDDGEDGAPAKKRARVERITVEGRDTDVTVMDLVYDPREFPKGITPKGLLINYCTKTKRDPPQYVSEPLGKSFTATVNVCGGRFGSSNHACNKRRAEQMAALVCIRALGLQLTTDGTDQRMQIDPTSQTPDRAAIVT